MPNPEAILSELEIFGVRLGLDRIEALLDCLSAPHRSLRVVLVAGTNGKGSTAAFLASILGASGAKVGLYTSPHLESIEERLRISGRSVSRSELGELLELVVATGRSQTGEPPTYFEALTAAALIWFQAEAVDIAVLEVGLGGRLDATNVTTPVLSIITSIGLDHQKVLGNSLEEIAIEKAGILRPASKALMWVDSSVARGSIATRAAEIGADLHDASNGVMWSSVPGSSNSMRLDTRQRGYDLVPPLAGRHQLDNLALAVVSAECLANDQGFEVTRESVEEGVRCCRWPGRLEEVEAGGQCWLLDGAHNVAAMEALRVALDRRSSVPRLMVFGALEDKSVSAMARIAALGADAVLLVPPNAGRAAGVEALAEALVDPPWGVAANVEEALDLAVDSSFEEIVVCGSLYLVGEVRSELRRRFGVPKPAADISTGL